ncbi:VanZ family protein [Microbacterium sp. P01]|uniref:VanZ family protein n=1 Tax=unclassified Microbacterium TaxID=2609290 RepID=UPI00366EA21B
MTERSETAEGSERVEAGRPVLWAPPSTEGRHLRGKVIAGTLLTLYLVALTLIALWPVPIDSGSGDLLRAITRRLPWVTYPRIEFGANILLFVPLGWLLAVLLAQSRYLVLPIAIVVTVAIECAQALLLDRRTPSLLDVAANTTGACIGLILAAIVVALRRRRA